MKKRITLKTATALLLCTLAIFLSPRNANAETTFINNFLFGHVTALTPGRAVINIGYTDRLRSYTEVAVYRYSKDKLTVVGTIRIKKIKAASASGSIQGVKALKVGDIIAVPNQHLVSIIAGNSLERYPAVNNITARTSSSNYNTLNRIELARKSIAQRKRLDQHLRRKYDSKTTAKMKYNDESKRIDQMPYSPKTEELKVFLKMTRSIREFKTYVQTSKRATYELSPGERAVYRTLKNVKGWPKPKAKTKKENDESEDS